MEVMAKHNTCYTSAACNRCPNIADWGDNRLICFGYNKAVSLYQEQFSTSTCKILSTCVSHTDKVNCVAWVKDSLSESSYFVSGGADSLVNVWHVTDQKIDCCPVCTLHGHTGSVTCVSALSILQGDKTEILIFTSCTDSTVRIWSVVGKDSKEIQQLNFGDGFALAVASCYIPENNVVLFACGCDDHKIHLYAREDSGKLIKVNVLAGHEDWVRGLDFKRDEQGDILLASCAQDNLIRVWRLTQKETNVEVAEPPVEKSVADMTLDEDIAVKETIFSFSFKGSLLSYAVKLDSVLSGHENWVYSVRWKPLRKGCANQKMQILSASMDKTMILWSPDEESGIWTEEVRVGDVGGNTLGFYGGLFSPCGQSILGHGYQGAFNQWTYDSTSKTWLPEVASGGHFGPVVDLAWSVGGADYVLSTSTDQTTRLHAPWFHSNSKLLWCEIARPQVHGYDIKCLAMLGKYTFASGADEKLVRVFTAPRNFISNFCHLCGHDVNAEMSSEECKSLPEGANVPALGLSNKAVFIADSNKEESEKVEENVKPGQYPENYFTPTSLNAPPSEDQLLQNTLWPEEGKLYGHGYEIFSLAAQPSRKIIASACKAAKADAANILLWDMETKKIISSLSGPTLTVTQMAFNHDGNRLLAVSRDRTWILYRETAPRQYSIEACVSKKTSTHSRIIWSCAWTPDDRYFLTASRDKTVCVWSVISLTQEQSSQDAVKPVGSISLSDSATAVDVCPLILKGGMYLVAVGLDSGHISVYLWSPTVSPESAWKLFVALSQSESHHLTVTRLAFRPCCGRVGQKNDQTYIQLASCGSDHAVRVYDLCLEQYLS